MGRGASFLVLLLLLAAAHAAIDIGKPSILCGEQSNLIGKALEGMRFSAAVSCPGQSVYLCFCKHTPKEMRSDGTGYTVSYESTQDGSKCECTFTIEQDLPEGKVSGKACTLCGGF